MKEISIYKAQSIGDQVTPSVMLIIDNEYPIHGDLESSRIEMGHQAHTIHNGLLSLPGGVYDRLFALMATNMASDLIVPHV